LFFTFRADKRGGARWQKKKAFGGRDMKTLTKHRMMHVFAAALLSCAGAFALSSGELHLGESGADDRQVFPRFQRGIFQGLDTSRPQGVAEPLFSRS
jgi:hypothetical protein